MYPAGMEVERLLSLARFRATSFGVVNARAPWGVQAPAIDYAIIYGVIDGPVWFECAGLSLELQAGDLVFLPHGARHRLSSSADVVEAELLTDILRRRPGQYVFNHGGKGAAVKLVAGGSVWDDASKTAIARLLPEAIIISRDDIAGSPHVSRTLSMIMEEAQAPRANSGPVVNALFNLLLTEILTVALAAPDLPALSVEQASSTKIARALMLIHSASMLDWTGDLLAERVGLSRAAFSRNFKNATGLSPGAYLQRQRLLRAADILRDSAVDLAGAAEHAGYNSIPSFCKAFKAEFGASPAAWRKLARAAQEGLV
ncbi:MAG: AraC family transcriptional regulator [Parvularculaceae bacterium]